MLVDSEESYSYETWETGSWDRRRFGNREEGERRPLKAATKQRIFKTENTLCAVVECVTQWDCRSYLQLRVWVSSKSN
jgi:hypothetical protein